MVNLLKLNINSPAVCVHMRGEAANIIHDFPSLNVPKRYSCDESCCHSAQPSFHDASARKILPAQEVANSV